MLFLISLVWLILLNSCKLLKISRTSWPYYCNLTSSLRWLLLNWCLILFIVIKLFHISKKWRIFTEKIFEEISKTWKWISWSYNSYVTSSLILLNCSIIFFLLFLLVVPCWRSWRRNRRCKSSYWSSSIINFQRCIP